MNIVFTYIRYIINTLPNSNRSRQSPTIYIAIYYPVYDSVCKSYLSLDSLELVRTLVWIMKSIKIKSVINYTYVNKKITCIAGGTVFGLASSNILYNVKDEVRDVIWYYL